jgi:hypothetical protein
MVVQILHTGNAALKLFQHDGYREEKVIGRAKYLYRICVVTHSLHTMQLLKAERSKTSSDNANGYHRLRQYNIGKKWQNKK